MYHFTPIKLRDGRPIPAVGEFLEHPDDIYLGEAGFQPREHPFDTLQSSPGSMLHKVKQEGNRLKIMASINATELLREFARWCALQVVDKWDAPGMVHKYLETGDTSLREEVAKAAEFGRTAGETLPMKVAARATLATTADGAGVATIGASREMAWLMGDTTQRAKFKGLVDKAFETSIGDKKINTPDGCGNTFQETQLMYYRFSPHRDADVEGCHMKRFHVGEVIEVAEHPFDSLMGVGFFVHGCMLSIVELEDAATAPPSSGHYLPTAAKPEKITVGRCTGINATINVESVLREFSYWCGRQMIKECDVPDALRTVIEDPLSYHSGSGYTSEQRKAISASRKIGLNVSWVNEAPDAARNAVEEAFKSKAPRPCCQWDTPPRDKFQQMVLAAFRDRGIEATTSTHETPEKLQQDGLVEGYKPDIIPPAEELATLTLALKKLYQSLPVSRCSKSWGEVNRLSLYFCREYFDSETSDDAVKFLQASGLEV
jgi:hypothetical protein